MLKQFNRSILHGTSSSWTNSIAQQTIIGIDTVFVNIHQMSHQNGDNISGDVVIAVFFVGKTRILHWSFSQLHIASCASFSNCLQFCSCQQAHVRWHEGYVKGGIKPLSQFLSSGSCTQIFCSMSQDHAKSMFKPILKCKWIKVPKVSRRCNRPHLKDARSLNNQPKTWSLVWVAKFKQ